VPQQDRRILAPEGWLQAEVLEPFEVDFVLQGSGEVDEFQVLCADYTDEYSGNYSTNKTVPCRTALLTFEPRSETMKVKHVTTWQFLGCNIDASLGSLCWWLSGWSMEKHLLATNYTRPITHLIEFPLRSIWISFVHVASCSTITDKVATPIDKRTRGHVNISDDVQRQTIESQDKQEERQICHKLEEIY
jgi:hypothetical protein